MKSIRKTIKYLVGIVLVAGFALGVFVYDRWTKRDAMVRGLIVQKIREVAPDWQLQIGGCRIDVFRSRVRILDVHIGLKGSSTPLAVFPETIVTLDATALTERQEVLLQHVEFADPLVYLHRTASGEWNWQKLPPIRKSNLSLPECLITRGSASLRWESANSVSQTFKCRDLRASLIPDGKRRFRVDGAAEVEQFGAVSLYKTELDFNNKTWVINGKLEGMRIDHARIESFANLSPTVNEKLVQLRSALPQPSDPTAEQNETHFGFASSESQPRFANATGPFDGTLHANAVSSNNPADLGFQAEVDIDFRLKRWQADALPEYKTLITVRDGQIVNPALPFPLEDLSGLFYVDNRHIRLEDIRGENDAFDVRLNGKFSRRSQAIPGSVNLELVNLACDQELRRRLPDSFKKVFDQVNPSGPIDLSVTLSHNASGLWSAQDVRIEAKGCSVRHQRFPYRIDDVTGTITQRPSEPNAPTATGMSFNLNLRGRGGNTPVTLDGYVLNLGPSAEGFYDIRADGVRIDDTFLDACQAQPKMYVMLKEFQARGVADMQLQFHKLKGIGLKHQIRFMADITNGTILYERFPYRIEDLSGTVAFDQNRWFINNIRGTHGQAMFTASGTHHKIGSAGQLIIDFETPKEAQTGIVIDDALLFALDKSAPQIREVIKELSLTGIVGLTGRLTKLDGGVPEFEFSRLTLSDGAVLMEPFPYPIRGIRASGHYRRITEGNAPPHDRLTIDSLAGSHDSTSVRFGKSYASVDPYGWTVRLNDLTVDRLHPDRTFLNALPEGLRSAFSSLDPNQSIGLDGMIEFRGAADRTIPVTAAWDLDTHFSGGAVTVGLDFTNVTGTATARGTWDGYSAIIDHGRIDLTSAEVLDYHLTDIMGPFNLENDRLIVGSAKAFKDRRGQPGPPQITPNESVTALAVDGIVTLNAFAALTETPIYQIELGLENGNLETYAKLYAPDQKNLHGTMNGWVSLQGHGSSPENISGRGQLQISPAALYELPVLAQVFGVLAFAPMQSTAFDYALVDFNIRNRVFDLGGIYLDGTAMSLRGRGTVGFDSQVVLDFYTMMSRRQLPVPMVNQIFGQLTSGWVGVSVRGTTSKPIARIKPVPNLDGALKDFLQAIPPIMAPVMQPRPQQPAMAPLIRRQ